MAYSHPKLKCWVCGTAPATHVVEAKAVVQFATAFEVESYHQMCCAHTVCRGDFGAATRRGALVNAPEPRDRHVARCAVWVSPDPRVPCDCGADDLAVDMPLLRPDEGRLADRIDHVDRREAS